MAIKMNEVTFKYNINTPLETTVFENMNLDLKTNQIHGIIGKSGSGKTTFVELIAGLQSTTSGKITVDECETKDEIIQKIGYVFQQPEQQFFNKTVEEEIGFATKQVLNKDKRISQALKMVGLNNEFKLKDPFKLSNGEMRKVAIASILYDNPQYIIFDEPTTGLDIKSKENLIKIIKMMKTKYNKTIIIVSHDIDLIHSICDNIIVIEDKKVIISGDKYTVFTSEEIKKCQIILPKLIEFSNLVLNKKNVKLGYRDDIKDLMKDVYRCV